MTDGYLRFADELVVPILEGSKRSTLRYELERDFETGDVVDLVSESDHVFAKAKIVLAIPINLHNVAHMDLTGLRPDGSGYDSVDELAAALREHYGEQGFDRGTVVDLISFAIVEPKRATVERPLPDGFERIAGVPVATPSRNLPEEPLKDGTITEIAGGPSKQLTPHKWHDVTIEWRDGEITRAEIDGVEIDVDDDAVDE